MGDRILDSSSTLGQRTLWVDSQGNGDFTKVQDALNHAAVYAAALTKWSVRVAPGEYAENLTLKDYVDLVGLAPGRAARIKPSTGSAIATPASCTVANLMLESPVSVINLAGGSLSGILYLDNIIIDQTSLDISPLSISSGTVHAYRCLLASGGGIRVQGGTLKLYHSIVRNQALTDGGYNYVICVEGGTVITYFNLLENVGAAGYCFTIDSAATQLAAYHTVFRKKDSTYAIDASVSQSMVLARCASDADHNASLTGYHDLVVDSSL